MSVWNALKHEPALGKATLVLLLVLLVAVPAGNLLVPAGSALHASFVVATVPVSVTYAVTPLGRTLMAAMQSMIDWAETRMPEVAAAQTAYDQRSPDIH